MGNIIYVTLLAHLTVIIMLFLTGNRPSLRNILMLAATSLISSLLLLTPSFSLTFSFFSIYFGIPEKLLLTVLPACYSYILGSRNKLNMSHTAGLTSPSLKNTEAWLYAVLILSIILKSTEYQVLFLLVALITGNLYMTGYYKSSTYSIQKIRWKLTIGIPLIVLISFLKHKHIAITSHPDLYSIVSILEIILVTYLSLIFPFREFYRRVFLKNQNIRDMFIYSCVILQVCIYFSTSMAKLSTSEHVSVFLFTGIATLLFSGWMLLKIVRSRTNIARTLFLYSSLLFFILILNAIVFSENRSAIILNLYILPGLTIILYTRFRNPQQPHSLHIFIPAFFCFVMFLPPFPPFFVGVSILNSLSLTSPVLSALTAFILLSGSIITLFQLMRLLWIEPSRTRPGYLYVLEVTPLLILLILMWVFEGNIISTRGVSIL